MKDYNLILEEPRLCIHLTNKAGSTSFKAMLCDHLGLEGDEAEAFMYDLIELGYA